MSRRLFVTLVVAVILPVPVFAQWQNCAGSSTNQCISAQVGVGTTNPTPLLHVHSASSSHAQLWFTSTGTSGVSNAIWFGVNYPAAGNWAGIGTYGEGNLRLSGNGTLAPSGMIIMEDNRVGIGTDSPSESHRLHVVGNVFASGTISAGGSIQAKYQDFAEWVPATQLLQPAMLVVVDPERPNHVRASTIAYDTTVAGVVSLQPGIVLGEGGPGKAMIATTGRVKIRVDATRGPVRIGDLLTTSDLPGHAMKSILINVGGVQLHRPGTIIGKALEPLASGRGEILALLTLQ